MALGSTLLKSQTVLQQLLEEINFQRTKEMRQLLKDGECEDLLFLLIMHCTQKLITISIFRLFESTCIRN